VPNFAAGGVSTPADASLVMQLGAEAVFVGSGIFKSTNPQLFARAIVKAVAQFKDAKNLLDASRGLGSAMPGLDVRTMNEADRLASRGV
jgi:pyridoxal 5'-phosphate synthase pdxS subunit